MQGPSKVGESARPDWLHSGEGVVGNRELAPPLWGLTMAQFYRFLDACEATPEWEKLNEKGHVNFYEINKSMIVPWTRNTGCSMARLLHPEEPCDAKLMISHAWAEDALAALHAIKSFLEKYAGCTKTVKVQFPEGTAFTQAADGAEYQQKFGPGGGDQDVDFSTVRSCDIGLWFCALSQYQPGNEAGDCGPTLQEQLALDPFKSVIESMPPYGMVVIHTSACSIYERLWCVHEVDEALDVGLRIIGESDAGSLLTMDPCVNCEKAHCGWAEDEAAIREKVLSKEGGFKRLDAVIRAFRVGMFAKYGIRITYGEGGDVEQFSTNVTPDSTVLQNYETWDGSHESLKNIHFEPAEDNK